MFILLAHLGCGILLITGLGPDAALWELALYLVRMLATTAIYHRLIAHGSYQAPRLVYWLGSLVAASAGQMGPSWWTPHHRDHHRHVDTAGDPHTPLVPSVGWRGFWRSQLGWLLSRKFPAVLCHGVASVNSIAHLFGTQPFATQDASRNNGWMALITLGEGWYNLHHAFQGSVRQGVTVVEGRVLWLPDPTYVFIKGLDRVRWAIRLRHPSERALLARARESQPQV